MPKPGTRPIVFVVDDDDDVREGLRALLNSLDMRCEVFRSTREFLQHKMPEEPSCLILDVRLPGASGLELQHELADTQIKIPIIFISGHGDIPMTVKAMNAGAVGFFTKPVHEQELLDSIYVALERDAVRRDKEQVLREMRNCYEMLSPREREVMAMVTAGFPEQAGGRRDRPQRGYGQGSSAQRDEEAGCKIASGTCKDRRCVRYRT